MNMPFATGRTEQGGGRPRRRGGRPRRCRPSAEGLEARWLPALAFQFAEAVGVVGSGVVDIEANAVAVDASGDVYITGSLQGTANFNAGTGGPANLSSTGNRDAFVAKYASSGALVWAKDLRGASASSVGQGSALAVDGSGNVYLTGTFSGTVNFDPNAGNTSFSASGLAQNDVFVEELDASGNLVWAQHVAGTALATDEGYAIAVDGKGNVYAGGSFQATATFGSTVLTASGGTEGFVEKLDGSGKVQWAEATGGSGNSVAQVGGLAVDGSGNVLATGFFAGTVRFGFGSGATSLSGAGARDIFVMKLDGSGNLDWAEGFGGPDINQGNAIATDASGAAYVTGTFSDTVDFNSGPGVTNLTAGGFSDPFVLKLDAFGNLVFARDLAGSNNSFSQGSGIGVDGSGNVYAAGYFTGTLQYDPSTPAGTLTSAGSDDAFVAEFDATGKAIAGLQAGGSNFDADFGIGVNAAGNVALTGRYTGPAGFGGTTLPAEPNRSLFVAELDGPPPVPPPPTAPSAPVLETASDTGVIGDGITAKTSPTFDVNQATPADTVKLLRDGTVVASRTGPGPITDPGIVSDGLHTYTAIQIDSFGQPSPASGVLSITIDTIPPANPAPPMLLPADDTRMVGDGITSVKQPRLTGSAEAGATVRLVSGGTLLATTTATGGTYTVQVSSALADGVYAVQAQAIDAAGNASALGAPLNLTIDTTRPAPPTPPTLLPADDTGVVGDGMTSVNQPRLTGFAEAWATVRLTAGSTLLATTTAGVGGSYTVQLSGTLADGAYAVQAQAIDAAGNASALGAPLNLTIDTTRPVTPAPPMLVPADDTGVVGNGITSVNQPRLTGSAEPGATVRLTAGGTLLATTTASPSGAYTVQVQSPLVNGVYAVQAQAIDAAGNASALSAAGSLTIDTTTPATPPPPMLLPADDTGIIGDGITSVNQPRLTGSAEAGATVRLTAGGTLLATTTAGPGGSYTVQVSGALPDGVYAVQAQAIDAAGNASGESGSFSLTIDTTAPVIPSAPMLLPADDTGVVGDGITSIKQPRLTGSAERGSTIRLTAGNTLLATTTATGGTYTVQVSGALADGVYAVQAQATDAAGNASALGTPLSLTINTSTPSTPAPPSLLPADDTGVVGDGITSIKQPRLTGTADPGSTVRLVVVGSGTLLATATAGLNGSYTAQVSSVLSNGSYSIYAQAINVAGTYSGVYGSFNLTIDTTPPATPPAPTLLPADDTGVVGDGITSVKQPRLTGIAEAGATVRLSAGSTLLATTTATGGTYTVQITSALADGVYAVQAQAIDAAGNASALGTALSLTINAAPLATPPPPTLLPADDTGVVGDGITSIKQPRLAGSAAPGTTVHLVAIGTGALLATATAGLNGSYTAQVSSVLSDGSYSIYAQAINVAGTYSGVFGSFGLTIDTTPPATPPAPTLLPADDTGVVGDAITSINQPHLSGFAEAGATVRLTAGGTLLATTTATGGTYAVQVSSALSDGMYAIQAQAIDAAGNASALGAALSLTIDTMDPATPAPPMLLPADDTGVVGDGITSVKQPRLTGTADPGSTVHLAAVGTGALLATATAGSNGSYTTQVSSPLPDGVYSIYAQAFDTAGNASGVYGTFRLTIDTMAPATPAPPSLLPADDTGVVGDGITSVKQPRLTGSAEPGATVRLTAGGTLLATTTASPSGAYTVQVQSPLANGVYAVQAQAIDAAGNASGVAGSLSLTIVPTAPTLPPTPAAPVLLASDDNGTPGDGITTVRRPHLSGSTVPGDFVDLIDASSNVLGTVMVSSSDGSFTVQPSANLGVGKDALRFRVRDASGHIGTPGPALDLTIEGVPDDLDGAGKSDIGVFRPSTSQWLAMLSGGGASVTSFGATNLFDIPVPGDYDGTGHAELAVFRPSTAQWFILGPSGVRTVSFGATNLFDIPVPGDYDGTGHTELAIFRPSTAQWFILGPSGVRTVSFGATNLFDIPVPGDYDGTGHTELAVFRPSTAQWLILGPSGVRTVSFGATRLFDLPLETSIASLVRLGVVGGLKSASLAVPVPAAEQVLVAPIDPSTTQADDRARASALDPIVDEAGHGRVTDALREHPTFLPRRHLRGGQRPPGALR